MATEIRLIKRPSGTVEPIGPVDRELWQAIPCGVEFAIVYRKHRNPQFHRFAWAIVTVAADNWPGDVLVKPAQVMRWLKLKTGLVDIERDPETGEQVVVPRSISFDAMGDDEFRPWFKQAISVVAQYLGISEADLTGELGELPARAPAKSYKLKGVDNGQS